MQPSVSQRNTAQKRNQTKDAFYFDIHDSKDDIKEKKEKRVMHLLKDAIINFASRLVSEPINSREKIYLKVALAILCFIIILFFTLVFLALSGIGGEMYDTYLTSVSMDDQDSMESNEDDDTTLSTIHLTVIFLYRSLIDFLLDTGWVKSTKLDILLGMIVNHKRRYQFSTIYGSKADQEKLRKFQKMMKISSPNSIKNCEMIKQKKGFDSSKIGDIDSLHEIFTTPLYIQDIDVPDVHRKYLADKVNTLYASWKKEFVKSDDSKQSQEQAMVNNEKFYEYQMHTNNKGTELANGFQELYKSDAYIHITNAVRQEILKHKYSLGIPSMTSEIVGLVPSSEAKNRFWFSVFDDVPGNVPENEVDYAETSFAGIFYIQSDKKSSRFYFSDPRLPSYYDAGSLREQREYYEESIFMEYEKAIWVEPRDNLLLMFPPWLLHGLHPESSENLDSTSNTSPKASTIVLKFTVGDTWQESVDNSLLDTHNCETLDLVQNNLMGVYGRDDHGELLEFNVTFAETNQK